MIIIENFSQVTAQIESERGIARDILVSAVEQALVSACRKKLSENLELEAELNPETGEAKIFQLKTVVQTVEDEETQIGLKEARKIDSSIEVDEKIRYEVDPGDFGRVAAQAAKQVIIQRIREAEKNVVFRDFKDKIGKIVIGTVQRVENQNYLINLGRAEAILGYRDQIPGERFMAKEKVKVLIVDLDKNAKGSFIQISRGHPGFLKELLIQEIPEIQDGIIEIMSVSREPGQRAKVAVRSHNPAVGAVGTCVGHMGTRIQSVTKELGREKIDVLEWHEEPKLFIASALKPAKVTEIVITSEKDRTAIVVVPNDQLSLAIGKGGINVRLAVKLTGWKLDVLNEDEYAKKEPGIREKSHISIIDRIKMEKQRAQQEVPVKTAASDEPEDDVKVKVSDLAKLLDMKSKDLVEKAQALGIEVKSVRSSLSPEVAQQIKEKLG